MNRIMNIIKGIIRTLFPNFYLNLRVKKFDTSAVIYKKMTYESFLEQAFRDFRPELSITEKNQLKDDILRTYLKDKTRPDEYLLYHYDTKSELERNAYLPQASKDTLLVSYYKGDVENTIGILRNKYIFYQLAKDFFKRDVILIGNETNNIVQFKEFCQKHPKFIAKEVDGGCGVGIKVVDTEKFGTIEEIFTDLSTTSTWIVEELIQQHPEISSYNESSVNTVRFPSFRHGTKVVAARPCMRFGRKGSVVDNAGQSGMFVSVDLNTGKIITDAFDEHGHKYDAHPDSKKVFKGFVIPQWKELIEVARKAHLSLPEDQVYVAFDFALSDKGWVIVEGNWGDWILQQTSLEMGLRDEFTSLLNG